MLRVFVFFIGLTMLTGACRNENAFLPTITPRPLPAEAGQAVQLFTTDAGEPHALWVETNDRGQYEFRHAPLEEDGWSDARLIARGDRNWFVNWADRPGLAQYRDDPEALAAFWLERSSRHPYDHHIMITQSRDGGQTWQAPFMPYEVRTPAFYGLCRLLPLPNGRMLAAWQDGRETVFELPHSGRTVPNINGRLALRAVEFDQNGVRYEAVELDSMISELTPFDMALTAEGPIIAYRDIDRSMSKDISVVRKVEGVWMAPQRIHPDNWQVSYYTLEGPAIDARENEVAVAWYANPNGLPEVKVALSGNAGETFDVPIRIDNGAPIGKVDVTFLREGRLLVSWVEKVVAGHRLMVAMISPRGRILGKEEVSEITGEKLAGVPALTASKDGALIAWKETADSFAPLRCVSVELE